VGLSEQAYFIPSSDADYASYRRFYQKAPPALR
jgi:phosphonate transport system substrate-binding protein